MKTRRSSLAQPPAEARAEGPRQQKKKKTKKGGGGVVAQLTKRVTLKRSGAGAGGRPRAGRAGRQRQQPPTQPEPEAAAEDKSAGAAGAASAAAAGAQRQRQRRRGSAAAAPGGTKGQQGDACIGDLSAETLHEVFAALGPSQGSFAREVLPLVCKRFRDLLAEPAPVWEVRGGLAARVCGWWCGCTAGLPFLRPTDCRAMVAPGPRQAPAGHRPISPAQQPHCCKAPSSCLPRCCRPWRSTF